MAPSSLDRTGFDAQQENEIFTIKLGGTRSPELAENAKHVQDLQQLGKKIVFAISAFKSTDIDDNDRTHEKAIAYNNNGNRKNGFNTTDHLILIAESVQSGDLDTARDALERMRSFTKDRVGQEVENDGDILEKDDAHQELCAVIDQHLDALLQRIDEQHIGNVHTVGEDRLVREEHTLYSFTGVGEQLAEALYPVYFRLRGIQCANVETDDLHETIFGDRNPTEVLKTKGQRDMAMSILTAELRRSIAILLPVNDVLVSGGYHAGVGTERGYSELTVALLSEAIQRINQRVACLIEGDYPLMSVDPNNEQVGQDAEFVPQADFSLAFEIFGNTGLGADGGAIHAPALEILARNSIDTVMLNPNNPRESTLIQHFEEMPAQGVDVVASRLIPDALVIDGPAVMFEPGVIHDITAWFAQKGISIVQTPSSQVKLSFTFTNGGLDDDLLAQFRDHLTETYGEDTCTANLIPKQSVVHCMGNNIHHHEVPARIGLALAAAGVTRRMETHAYESSADVVGVDSADLDAVTEMIHKACVTLRDTAIGELYSALESNEISS